MKHLAAIIAITIVAVSGCGGEPTVSTEEAVTALRDAGFRDLAIHSNVEVYRRLARERGDPDLARDALDVDTIYPRERYENFVTMPFVAVRLPPTEMAETRYENDRPLFVGQLTPAERELLPADFDPSLLREERVCNVVVSSYNADDDPELTRRFQRATELLHDACD